MLGLKFRSASGDLVHVDAHFRSRGGTDLFATLLYSLVAELRRSMGMTQREPPCCWGDTDYLGACIRHDGLALTGEAALHRSPHTLTHSVTDPAHIRQAVVSELD
jgi:hypothetical protein